MTVDQPQEISVGERLLTLGWQQGTVFAAPALPVMYHKLNAEDRRPIPANRSPKNSERFIVISQDCDIKSSQEPYIEALLCMVTSESLIRKLLDAKSARWFTIDEKQRLVAQAKYRVLLEKEILLSLTPAPWPSSLERRLRFITWLGRRYDRPALPDDIVEQLQQPLERVLSRINEEHPQTLMLFSGVVHEVRVSQPWTAEPPYQMQLVLMIQSDQISAEEADAINIVIDEIQAEINCEYILLDSPRIVTEDQISLREYRGTWPIFLDYLTYQGNEINGIEPLKTA
ncbi:hypothetical protein EKD04_019860 [Chloroflexales bacterium ZM16-3]|nr:hypothetical protein [Chloroflexales bacterium ZM16-3]